MQPMLPRQQQQPQCDQCGASAYWLTETGTHIVYRCLSTSRHLMYVEKPAQQSRSVQWNNPNNAA